MAYYTIHIYSTLWIEYEREAFSIEIGKIWKANSIIFLKKVKKKSCSLEAFRLYYYNTRLRVN